MGNAFHVLHVTQPTDGGVATDVRGLVADQARRGWRVSVACPAGPSTSWRGWWRVSVFAWEARRSGAVRDPRARSAGVAANAATGRAPPPLLEGGLLGRVAATKRDVLVLFQPHGWSFQTVAAGSMTGVGALGTARRADVRADRLRQAERERVGAPGSGPGWRWFATGCPLTRYEAHRAEAA
jgi:hypothetical protein